jgi:hypothetical protein
MAEETIYLAADTMFVVASNDLIHSRGEEIDFRSRQIARNLKRAEKNNF